MITRWVRHIRYRAIGRASDDLFQLRDGLARQADRHPVAGQYVQFPPALQRAGTDAADTTTIQFYRVQLQHGGDAAAAADAELDISHPGQCPLGRMFPGDGPVGCLGLPVGGGWTLTLAQYHAVGGEGQGLGEPALALGLGTAQVRDRHGIAGDIQPGLGHLGKTFGHLRRAVGPVPDEQANGRAFFIGQLLTVHQTGDTAARAGAASAGLHMLG